jgi:hypothetical protein
VTVDIIAFVNHVYEFIGYGSKFVCCNIRDLRPAERFVRQVCFTVSVSQGLLGEKFIHHLFVVDTSFSTLT